MAGNLYEQGYLDSGTASVTQGQTLVTGQGTNWLQIVRPADDFGKHVGRPIPIASVDSNTQLTLAYPWPGPTQAAADYRITFTPYHVAYRQALQEIGALLASGGVSALAMLEGSAGKLPFFTGPGTMGLANLSDFAGDVVGPLGAADGGVALFDGATGKLLKNGGVLGSAALQPYETGFFTSTLSGLAVAGSPTYVQQQGSYVQIGKLTYVTVYLVVTNLGGADGQLLIGGLPFPMASGTVKRPLFHSGFWTGFDLGTPYTMWTGFMLSGNTVRLYRWSQTSGTEPLNAAQVTGTVTVYGNMVYEAA
ncbi:hypothetical protein [Nitratireductor pacificus]|uniref:Uncharacterized protein n=1 Tax=Nitratireductor pacificus pht-3B TaxID=391937 RepID=K2MIR7_9HYPH|nr:hypothetical protein [Nitratireductor pacificus]EKF17052.1 hypothetical protein NA2_19818 [Nitratireductor pacificus pht-3B]